MPLTHRDPHRREKGLCSSPAQTKTLSKVDTHETSQGAEDTPEAVKTCMLPTSPVGLPVGIPPGVFGLASEADTVVRKLSGRKGTAERQLFTDSAFPRLRFCFP